MIDPNDRSLVARKGAAMMCVNGHRIAQLTDDLRIGTVNYSAKFLWIQPNPIGQMEAYCTICKAKWFGSGSKFYWIEEDGVRHE